MATFGERIIAQIQEYGNYGGRYHSGGEWIKDDSTQLKYRWVQWANPIDGQDELYRLHDMAYGYTEIRLERGDITQEQAIIEKTRADIQLITNLTDYDPTVDPSLSAYRIPAAAAHKESAIVGFLGKMLYDGGRLIENKSRELFDTATGWIKPDDGFLVLDRDGNGEIDNGTELFGNFTPLANGMFAVNGFQALAQFDTNGDGKIDASDPIWSQLKVWQHDTEATDLGDPDSSGIFTTLDELGIQSISTGYANSTFVDANGNAHKEIGSFTWNNGTTNSAEDVWFKTDNMYTIANEWLDVPEDIAALPDLQGYGNVYDLQQAMVRDESGQLKSLVEQFAAETDSDARHALITQILYKWTGVENIDPASRAARIIYGNVVKNHAKAPLSFLTGDIYKRICLNTAKMCNV